MSKNITFKDVKAGLESVVARHGADHEYKQEEDGDGCVYVHGTGVHLMLVDDTYTWISPPLDEAKLTPGCIVGVLLVEELGVKPIDIVKAGINRQYGAAQAISRLVQDGKLKHVSRGARDFLERVQEKQDHGDAWGSALAETLEEGDWDY